MVPLEGTVEINLPEKTRLGRMSPKLPTFRAQRWQWQRQDVEQCAIGLPETSWMVILCRHSISKTSKWCRSSCKIGTRELYRVEIRNCRICGSGRAVVWFHKLHPGANVLHGQAIAGAEKSIIHLEIEAILARKTFSFQGLSTSSTLQNPTLPTWDLKSDAWDLIKNP